jgi:hypothetical protein
MSRATISLVLLLASALYVSAIRQPLQLGVLEPTAAPTTLVVPQAASVEAVPTATTVVAQATTVSPLDPTLVNTVTPQAAVEAVVAGAVVAPEAVTPVDPTTAAADVATVAVNVELVTPADAVLPVDSTAEGAGVAAQTATHPAVTAWNGKTLGVGYSGSGFLVSKDQA